MTWLISSIPPSSPKEYCVRNTLTVNYTYQVGFEITDESGNDKQGVLKGSPQGYISFVSGPTTTINIKDTKPRNNTLMDIPPFAVINAEKVKVTMQDTKGELYISEVSRKTLSVPM